MQRVERLERFEEARGPRYAPKPRQKPAFVFDIGRNEKDELFARVRWTGEVGPDRTEVDVLVGTRIIPDRRASHAAYREIMRDAFHAHAPVHETARCALCGGRARA